MLLADALSRLPSRTAQDIIPLDLQVHFIAFSDIKIQAITAATLKDPILSITHCLTANGWPSRCSDIPKIAQCY